MFYLEKNFNVSYAHRLPNQKLFEHFSDEYASCINMHGHNGVITVTFKSEKLHTNGVVVDYKNLQGLKQAFDVLFDHAMVLRDGDVVADGFVQDMDLQKWLSSLTSSKVYVGKVLNPVTHEAVGKCTLLEDKDPTSENLAELCYDISFNYIQKFNREAIANVYVKSVAWAESNGGKAIFEN